MSLNKRLVKSAGPVGAATLLSRMLGLVREQVFAYYFGASMYNDAFVAAFRIPNFFRDMFAEGALSAAFVPVFTETLEKEGEEAAWELANRLFAFLSGLVTAVVALGMALAPWLVPLVTWGYTGEKLRLTVELTQLMFPFLLLISIAALLMGVLNATNRFFVPALSSSVLNLAMILSGIFLVPFFEEPIFAMAWGVLIGGVLQIVIQLPQNLRQGWRPRWHLDLTHPKLRRVLRLAIPMIPGYSATQIVIFTNTLLASLAAAGAMSYLNYSYRLMHLPLGIFAVSVATVILPTLSRQAAAKNMNELKDTLAFGLRLVFYFTLPAMTLFIVLAEPICRLVYQYGDFTAATTHSTALALRYRSLGLVGFAGVRILAPAYYSLQDTRTPFTVTGIVVAVNVILAVALVKSMDFVGIALASSCAGTVNLLLLLILLRRKVGLIRGRSIASSLVRVGMACVVMGCVALLLNRWSIQQIGITTVGERLLGFSLSGGAGLLAFWLTAMILRVEEGEFLFRMVKNRLSRGRQ